MVRKERVKVRTTLKETESHKNLATIVASLANRLVTVAGDNEMRKKSKTTMRREQIKEVKNHGLIADETDLMFSQHVVHADKITDKEKQKPMRTSVLVASVEQDNARTETQEPRNPERKRILPVFAVFFNKN